VRDPRIAARVCQCYYRQLPWRITWKRSKKNN